MQICKFPGNSCYSQVIAAIPLAVTTTGILSLFRVCSTVAPVALRSWAWFWVLVVCTVTCLRSEPQILAEAASSFVKCA